MMVLRWCPVAFLRFLVGGGFNQPKPFVYTNPPSPPSPPSPRNPPNPPNLLYSLREERGYYSLTTMK